MHEPVEVLVALANPLPQQVVVQLLALQGTGTRVEAQPHQPITLAPKQPATKLRLRCIPLEPGLLDICGLAWSSFRITSFCTVPKLSLRVLPPLPLLRLSLEGCGEPQVLLDGHAAARDEVDDHRLGLFVGEVRTLRLWLHNAGQLPVRRLEVRCQGFTSAGPPKPGVEVRVTAEAGGQATGAAESAELALDGAALLAGLPIAPGASRAIDLQLRGACEDTSLLVVKVRYCCAAGDAHGWCGVGSQHGAARLTAPAGRESQLRLRLNVRPIVEVAGVELSSDTRGGGGPQCLFSFDIRNEDPRHMAEVQVAVRGGGVHTSLVDSHSVNRMHVMLPPAPVGEAGDADGARERLHQLLTLTWRLPALRRHGVLRPPIDALPRPMLARLAPEPVRVTISRRDAAGGGRCAVYAAVPVEVRVENLAATPSEPLVLSVLPFQDGDDGTRHYAMQGLIEAVGLLESSVPALEPGAVHTHHLAVVCCCAGMFKLSCLCRRPDALEAEAWVAAPLELLSNV